MKFKDVTYIMVMTAVGIGNTRFMNKRELPARLVYAADVAGNKLNALSNKHMLRARFAAPKLSYNGIILSSMGLE